MTVTTWVALTTVLLDALVGTLYCVKLVRKETAPRLATWLIFEVGVLMSLAAYFSSPGSTLVKAALNATDAIVVTAILGLIVITQRTSKFQLTLNEKVCLAISCVAGAAWGITRTGWVGVAGFQVLMSVAYGPTIESVWKWQRGRPPEPLETWSLNALIGLMGAVSALTGARDYVAMLYPLRAFLLCALVVVLIARWDLKNREVEHPQ